MYAAPEVNRARGSYEERTRCPYYRNYAYGYNCKCNTYRGECLHYPYEMVDAISAILLCITHDEDLNHHDEGLAELHLFFLSATREIPADFNPVDNVLHRVILETILAAFNVMKDPSKLFCLISFFCCLYIGLGSNKPLL